VAAAVKQRDRTARLISVKHYGLIKQRTPKRLIGGHFTTPSGYVPRIPQKSRKFQHLELLSLFDLSLRKILAL
jgi:hypothetical protein